MSGVAAFTAKPDKGGDALRYRSVDLEDHMHRWVTFGDV